MFNLILAFAASYILGSVSFANLAGKIKGIELSREGSGTLGARNVKRMIEKCPASAVFILDILKEATAILMVVSLPFIIHLIMDQHSFTSALIAVCALIFYFHKVNLEEVIRS